MGNTSSQVNNDKYTQSTTVGQKDKTIQQQNNDVNDSDSANQEVVVNDRDFREEVYEFPQYRDLSLMKCIGQIQTEYDYTMDYDYKEQTSGTGTVYKVSSNGIAFVLTCAHNLRFKAYRCLFCDKYDQYKICPTCSSICFRKIFTATHIEFNRRSIIPITYGYKEASYECTEIFVPTAYEKNIAVKKGFDFAILMFEDDGYYMQQNYELIQLDIGTNVLENCKRFGIFGYQKENKMYGYAMKRDGTEQGIEIRETTKPSQDFQQISKYVLIQRTVDATGGQSGSPVFIKNENVAIIFAVHVGGHEKDNEKKNDYKYNVATLLNETFLKIMVNATKIWNVPWKLNKPRVKDNTKPVYESDLKDENIIKCIGVLEVESYYYDCNEYLDNVGRHRITGTVFYVQPDTGKAFIISSANNLFFKEQKAFATSISFTRRSNEKEMFGKHQKEYPVQIEYISQNDWLSTRNGLGIAVFSFKDTDNYYSQYTTNIELAEAFNTLTEYNKFNMYGYRYYDSYTQLWGSSTVGDDFGFVQTVPKMALAQSTFILKQNEIFSNRQNGSVIWVKDEKTGKILIFAVNNCYLWHGNCIRSKDISLIKSCLNDTENHHKSLRECGCGGRLLKTAAKNCYENKSVSVSCTRCNKVLRNKEIVYHCWKGTSERLHTNGYDLCKYCATQQIKLEHTLGGLFEDTIVRITRFSMNKNPISMMNLKLLNKHWYKALDPRKPEVNEIWEHNLCRQLFKYIPKNLKVKRWDRYCQYKYFSLLKYAKHHEIYNYNVYHKCKMVENCAYIIKQLNDIKYDFINKRIGSHGLPKGYKLKHKCPVLALNMNKIEANKYSCDVCKKNVHIVDTEQQMVDMISRGKCVQFTMLSTHENVEFKKKAKLQDRRHPIAESPVRNEQIMNCIGVIEYHYDYGDNAHSKAFGTGTAFAVNKDKVFIISNAALYMTSRYQCSVCKKYSVKSCSCKGNKSLVKTNYMPSTSMYFFCDKSGTTEKHEIQIEYFNEQYLSFSGVTRGFDCAMFSFEDASHAYAQLTENITISNGIQTMKEYGRFNIYGYGGVALHRETAKKILTDGILGNVSGGKNYVIAKSKYSGRFWLKQKEVYVSCGGPVLWIKDEMSGSVVIFGIHTGYNGKWGYKVANLLCDEQVQHILDCISA
eukprot:540647_1